jgi:hypothetical protein
MLFQHSIAHQEVAPALISAALRIERGFDEPLSAALLSETLAWSTAVYGERADCWRRRRNSHASSADISAFGSLAA